MTDELQYVKLALSAAETLSPFPAIHGASVATANQLYPLLLAPVVGPLSAPDAFRAAHVLNAFLMTSAAVPAYLLGRELLDRAWSFVVAVSSVVTALDGADGRPHERGGRVPRLPLGDARPVSGDRRAEPSPGPSRVGRPRSCDPGADTVRHPPRRAPGRDPRPRGDLPGGGDTRRPCDAGRGSEVGGARSPHVVGRLRGRDRRRGRAALVGHRLLGAYETTVEEGSLLPSGVWVSAPAARRHGRHRLRPAPASPRRRLASRGRPPAPPARPPRLRDARDRHRRGLALQTASFDLRFGGPEIIRDRYLFYVVPLLLVASAAALTEDRRRPVAIGVVVVTVVVAATAHGLPFPTFPGLSLDTPVSILNETLIEQSGSLGTRARSSRSRCCSSAACSRCRSSSPRGSRSRSSSSPRCCASRRSFFAARSTGSSAARA